MQKRIGRVVLGSIAYLAISAGESWAQWVQFSDQTSTRLVATAGVALTNPDEKDYAWADVDQDGDIDLVAVYKEPFTTTGRRRNVLFMNEGVAEGQLTNGVLVDRTTTLIPQFLDLTNDRDVILVDLNGDGWLEIVTATTLSGSQPKAISHPRIYINQGDDAGGVWQGYLFDDVDRIPTMPVEPRFCSVSSGDIDSDGDKDLYFTDYNQGPYSRPSDLNDRLLINNGSGYFTDQTATRMTFQMVESSFGMASAIADINGDSFLDIVKDTALTDPIHVSVSYNDSSNEGFFDVFDEVYNNAPYHVSVGDLNNDAKLDLVITDDGNDRYLLNQGNTGGLATFIERTFIGSVGEFGGEQVIADLNNDGFLDVFITDVDVDAPGCSRRSKIYRNLGNVPNVTLQEQGTAGITNADLTGLHDVAVFDINGDGWKDVVLGQCTGTRVYMNVPPAGVLLFAYPEGIPYFVRPDTGDTFQVQVTGATGLTPQPGTGVLYVSVNNGPFTNSSMTHLGNNLYNATLPTGTCTDRLRFYVQAQSTLGGIFLDPPNAPTSTYSAVLAVSTTVLFRDEIEGSVASWTISNDPSLTGGAWEQANPNGTIFGGEPAAPEDDATEAADKVMAFVTGNGPVGGAAGDSDVDGGPTRLISPVFDLTATDATISYSRWFFCSSAGTPQADSLIVEVSNNGGSSYVPVHTVTDTNNLWESASFLVGDFVTPTAQVVVRFRVVDTGNNSVTEAGVDNFQVEKLSCVYCKSDLECDDENPCTTDRCSHGTCGNTNNSLPCDDGNSCTVNDACTVGNCIGNLIPGCVSCTVDAECDDANPCTDDTCVLLLCQHANNSATCDDGNACTENDVCVLGTCGGNLIPNCQPCVTDSDCDDDRFCNGVETCVNSTCEPGAPPCSVGQPCDELADSCTLTLQARMGDPVLGLTSSELARFVAGRVQFAKPFLAADGLGPIFNQTSCLQCHSGGGGGGAGTIVVTRFGKLDKAGFDPLSDYGGSLLQSQALDGSCQEIVPPEANITAIRSTPALFGAGLVEAIPEADILANANNPPPGINGLAHLVGAFEDPQGSPLRVGRFGWKAQVATMLTFSADALLNEMGITNRFIPLENAPNGNQTALALCDTVADPEDGPDLEGYHFIDRVADFQRFLAQPPQTPKSGMAGEAIFTQIGCTDCHKPQFVTRTAPETALSGRTIRPYSDFLLHNMGALSDGIVQGDAPGSHMRTTSLWGLRVRDPMLHDASVSAGTFADRIMQVVVAHDAPGSEAATTADNFLALSSADQAKVVAFLDSLGRAEFDHDGDNDVDTGDFLSFWSCYRNAGPYTPDDPCAISDIEQDGDVDNDDFALFMQAFDGTPSDCNNNTIVDFAELVNGSAGDCNGNAILDECDGFLCTDNNVCTTDSCNAVTCAFANNTIACDDGDGCTTDDVCGAGACAGTAMTVLYADLLPQPFGDGITDIDDLLCLLSAFSNIGDCPQGDIAPCSPDGVVDLDDLLSMLSAFGQDYACPHPCPAP